MNLEKIGRFIAEKRKQKGLTQIKLAEKLNVSEKTISKWECGNGFPDTSLIMPLCNELNITANELLCGENITTAEYQAKAEDNIIRLMQDKQDFKKKLVISLCVCFSTLLAGITLVLLSGLLDLEVWLRVILIVIAVVVIAVGIGVACVLDREAGSFECPHCKAKFSPDMKNYIMGAHTLTKRYLKCPNCGKSSYCKHRMTK